MNERVCLRTEIEYHFVSSEHYEIQQIWHFNIADIFSVQNVVQNSIEMKKKISSCVDNVTGGGISICTYL